MTGNEVYGNSPGLRTDLEARQLGYVLAVARDHRVGFGGVSHRVDALLAIPAGVDAARQHSSAHRRG